MIYVEIGATKTVQERLKTTKIDEINGASLVFCWDTHLTKIKGRNVLFIVNSSNRYTIAMTDIEPRNWKYYTLYISRVIHGVMQEMGYSEEQIAQYFKMSGSSFMTDETGGLKACASRDQEEILTGVYDLDDLADKRLEWGLFRDRRPEMYRKITQ